MKKINVLIVDDIFINRVLLSEIIMDLGHSYQEAANGREAVNLMENEDFDLILMDIEMPVMNGFETTQFIRNSFTSPKCKTPIIAITAHDPNIFVEELFQHGFNELITKPYTIDKITNIIDKFCN